MLISKTLKVAVEFQELFRCKLQSDAVQNLV